MSDAQHYDVIVITTGAGSGTLARRPVPSGRRIPILERGEYLPREFWYEKVGAHIAERLQ